MNRRLNLELGLSVPKNTSSSDGSSGRICKRVKVKRKGMMIVRKIDINQHTSYHSLLHTLERMFSSSNDSPSGNSAGVVAYEDGDGDWMLLGDIPWEMFVDGSVKRLKIMN
ncbi:Auxin responsive protein [Zostera marina]|uniref:Auxin-responsive protein n=1 Tax=Zostera marina TaxID=29655 RepID=A0A0K9Q426_ZOSMR|nr:Auxin responsive protein [Zostera marina]